MANSTTDSDKTDSVRSSWHSHTQSISSQSSASERPPITVEHEKSVGATTTKANGQDDIQQIQSPRDPLEVNSDNSQCLTNHIDWIYGTTYTKVEVDGQHWCILKRLTEEKSQWCDDTCISRALYACIPWFDRCDSKVAVMKIYMQIGGTPQAVPAWIEKEIEALRVIRRTKDQADEVIPAPGLQCSATYRQDEQGYVEKGFTTFIVMDRMPGRTLRTAEFRSYTEEEQDLIRFEFKRSLMKLWELGIAPTQYRIEDIIWRKKPKICYIVGLRGAYVEKPPLRDVFINGTDFYLWGLADTWEFEKWDKKEAKLAQSKVDDSAVLRI